MNSTKEDVRVNLALQEEASSSGNKPLTSPDRNANVNASSSRGAIPKNISVSKLATTSKKPVKINNNIEDVSLPLSHVQLRDRHQQNGFVECLPSQVPSSYLPVNIEDSYTSEKFWSCDKMENEEAQFLTLSDLQTFRVPLASQCDKLKDNFNDFDVFRKDCQLSDSSSEGNELLSISDDGCIYTYKGDQVADLPSSFFSLEIPLQPSPDISAQNRQENDASPEMDYLEMDFDPGPSGDADSDTGSNTDLENAQNLPKDIEREFGESSKSSLHETKMETPSQTSRNENQNITENRSTVEILPEGNSNIDLSDNFSSEDRQSAAIPEEKTSEKLSDHNAVLISQIRSLKLPWLYSPNRPSVDLNILPSCQPMKDQLLTCITSPNADFGCVSDNERDRDTVKQSKSCNSSPDNQMFSKSRKVMIWSEEEACKKQVSQIGTSACGATAVLNVLKALRFPVPSSDKIQALVKTRLRENASPLTEYLLSRSVAGCTHEDIISGLAKASNGEIYARFFHLYPERDFDLCCFLRFWIKNGAVPVTSLNCQKCGGNGKYIPDAWHHQMVFGVGPRGVYLTNPLEYVDIVQIWPQLCSESVLLVRRDDVLQRWNQKIDLPRLMSIQYQSWRNLNVVGQVANMVRESKREFRKGFTNTSHLKIPAAYSSGITIAVLKSNPTYPLLRFCDELPLLNRKKN